MKRSLAAPLAACILTLALIGPASAKIRCDGIYQITKYGPISTPYCQEKEIARVARAYGARVSDEQVRSDPLTKVYLCFTYGNDVRLKGACGAYAPEFFR